jgi:thymidylate synthase
MKTEYLNSDGSPFTIEQFREKVKSDKEFALEYGNLGPIYGAQWRNWGGKGIITPQYITEHGDILKGRPYERKGIDQIQNAIDTLKTNPDSRRILVNAWNVGELDKMLFPPCHYGFTLNSRELTFSEKVRYVRDKYGNESWYNINEPRIVKIIQEPKRGLYLKWNQRSVDTFLGLPFNIASYGMLLLMIAQVIDMVPLELICSLEDTHLYKNHIDQAREQLTREPRSLPRMLLNPDVKNIDDFKYEDFTLVDYNPHPHIKAPISI